MQEDFYAYKTSINKFQRTLLYYYCRQISTKVRISKNGKSAKNKRLDEEVETELKIDKEKRRGFRKESSENKRKRRKSYPGFQSRGLVPSLFLSFFSFSPGDLNGSADVSFHNLIVLIKFRRRIALRWAYRPGRHNANCDVYRMNREWNSK